jgi:hypothetical protein
MTTTTISNWVIDVALLCLAAWAFLAVVDVAPDMPVWVWGFWLAASAARVVWFIRRRKKLAA